MCSVTVPSCTSKILLNQLQGRSTGNPRRRSVCYEPRTAGPLDTWDSLGGSSHVAGEAEGPGPPPEGQEPTPDEPIRGSLPEKGEPPSALRAKHLPLATQPGGPSSPLALVLPPKLPTFHLLSRASQGEGWLFPGDSSICVDWVRYGRVCTGALCKHSWSLNVGFS